MSRITELEKQLTELEERKVALQHELELEKQKTNVEYPFEEDKCWWVNSFGETISFIWVEKKDNTQIYDQGNIFNTKQEAQRESDRRILLTRFKQFRDKCNGDWKPDWHSIMANKYHIGYDYESQKLDLYNEGFVTKCCVFGYFKNEQDGYRAINLFGDEIKRLFVEEEK